MTYDQFLSLAKARRSIRKFAREAVSPEDLVRLLEAARWAPSNHNRQPWKFIVLEDRPGLLKLANAVREALLERFKALPTAAAGYMAEFGHYATFFSEAPVLIAVVHKLPMGFSKVLLEGVSHPELVSGEPLSAAMAVQNLLLAAHSLGLGACTLTAPLIVRHVVTRELGVSPGAELTCLVAVGHPDEQPEPPHRKNIEQIAEFRKDGLQ